MIIVTLGKIQYDEALQLQEECHTARLNGRIADDIILLLEHDPVITFGRSAGEEDLLVSVKEIENRGINFRRVNRGGKITCHYPGQLVGYLIFNLESFGLDIHEMVRSIESTIIRMLADYGISGHKIRHMTGVWVDNNKIAALGMEVRNGVTLHGFSFNIRDNPDIYSFIVPCGIKEKGVTSLERVLNNNGSNNIDEIIQCFIKHWPDISGMPITSVLQKQQFETKYLRENKTERG